MLVKVVIYSIPFIAAASAWAFRRLLAVLDSLRDELGVLSTQIAVLGTEVETLKEQGRRQHEQNLAKLGRNP